MFFQCHPRLIPPSLSARVINNLHVHLGDEPLDTFLTEKGRFGEIESIFGSQDFVLVCLISAANCISITHLLLSYQRVCL